MIKVAKSSQNGLFNKWFKSQNEKTKLPKQIKETRKTMCMSSGR